MQRTNVFSTPLISLRRSCRELAGILPGTAGFGATVYAQLGMGVQWRIGVDEQENTTLVRTGPFKWVRHPIYTAMMAFGLGLLLVTPNLVALAGFILLVATLEVHVRRVEEPYLLRTHSAVYRGYTASVGRFVPGVGLIR
ncbi:isoprenylcysteine carboxylmethyltransferase family protein [Mycobacterium tuberculosis]